MVKIKPVEEEKYNNNLNVTLLQNQNKKIKYVVHLADIHIKKRDRNDEFRCVFANLINILKEKKLDSNNTIIVVAGDVIDNGVDLHPQSVKLTKDFVILLASVADVVIISGNHDQAENNEQYNGLLSIVQNLETQCKVFMLVEQGLYEYNNILFGHTKFGENQYVQPCNIQTNKIKCGLYHGTLHGSKIESGIEFKNDNNKKYLTVGDFKYYDYTFLGDIHKMSFLTDTVAYPGSLLQLDSSESLEKGIILWNLENKKGEFIQVKSDYGIVNVSIDENGKHNIDITKLPKHVNMNLECQSMDRKHIDNFYSQITLGGITIGKKNDKMICDQNTFDTKLEINGKKQDMILIRNKDDVIDLLISKLDNNLNKTIVQDLKNILSDSLKNYEFTEVSNKKNIKLISFNFDNMAIFGSDNVIDFTKLNGIIGLPGANSIGKSSFVDAILQGIFGECTRGSRFDMININANSYKSEIVLDVNSVRYKIKRIANRNSQKKNIVDTESKEKLFLYENDNNITDKTLKKTQDLINQKIGTMFDFVSSCFVTQKSVSQGECIGFAELEGKERKNMLCKIARLDVYDYLSTVHGSALFCVTQELGKYKSMLNIYNEFGNNKEDIKKDIFNKIEKLEVNISQTNMDIEKDTIVKTDIQKNISRTETEIKNINEKIFEIESGNKHFKLNNNIETQIEKICDLIKKLENESVQKESEKNKTLKEIKVIGDVKKVQKQFDAENKSKILLLRDQIKEKRKMVTNNCDFNYAKYNEKNISKEIIVFENEINKLDAKIFDTNDEIKGLNVIVNNNIVKIDKIKVDEFNNKQNELQKINDKVNDYEEEHNKYDIMYRSLKDHEYDENCEYCMKNTATKEKIRLEKTMDDIKKNIDDLQKKKRSLNLYITKNKLIVIKYNDYVEALECKKNAERQLLLLNKDLELFASKTEILNKKKDDLLVMKSNYVKYIESKKIEKEIDILESDIDIINNSVCDDVIKYDKLMKKLGSLEIEIKNNEINIEKNKGELEKQKNVKKMCDDNKDLLLKSDKLENDKVKLKDDYKKYNKELNFISQKIIINSEKIKKDQTEITDLKHKYNTFVDLFNNIVVAEKKKDNYTILTQLLKSDGGIIDMLMVKNLLPKLNEIVNSLFCKFGEDEVKITYEKSKIIIRDDVGVDVVKNGGYKSYLNNLVYRIAISQLNAYMSTDFMIIDEVCDSADVDNKTNIKKLIDYLRQNNKWTLIISHDDDVKDKFEKRLVINKNKQITRSHKIELM